jgi:hypothetical protein
MWFTSAGGFAKSVLEGFGTKDVEFLVVDVVVD